MGRKFSGRGKNEKQNNGYGSGLLSAYLLG
jgi:hypothetical protein